VVSEGFSDLIYGWAATAQWICRSDRNSPVFAVGNLGRCKNKKQRYDGATGFPVEARNLAILERPP
jgi:hypothetical protein